ncbi:MAG: HNH endonuclease [Spirochaetes bacterium]|nr:HNH endonuclease [Spirochaetota bacterium]
MNKMNSLDRSLIEKAGYDNGFEIVQKSDPSVVSLCSSLHTVKADITIGNHEGAYALRFSDTLSLPELKRGLNNELFQNGRIEAWNRELLGVVLKRAAELGIALPDGPIRLYNGRLDTYLDKNPEERSSFNGTEKSMFRGTEREQLVKQRIGQDVFREALFKYWKNCCAVTSLDIPEMLRASHIKPWGDCDNDSDRLNVYNGFLLSANYDALFDKGLITFDDKGVIIYSNRLNKRQIIDIGGDRYKSLHWIDERHLPFLEWHRNHVFLINQ